MILLDTDIVIDLQRGFPAAIEWLQAQPNEEDVCLPGLVAMELVQGCLNRRDVKKVQDFIRPFSLLWPASDVCDVALQVYARGRLTHNLGLLDALIGQLAVSMNLPLHTFNQKHFAAVPNLKTIQPCIR